jgi:Uncharacterized protein conserved in bacteria
MKERIVPNTCPSCGGKLMIGELYCQGCPTKVCGSFDLPPLMRLNAAEQEFVESFVTASGSLKDMAKIMNLSYPTVRNRLDEIILKLKMSGTSTKEK